jgi:hypothetical protein
MESPVESTIKAGPPRVRLLSNGRYAVMVISGGGGYSRWRDLELSRWRADPTRDSWGSFLYARLADTPLGRGAGCVGRARAGPAARRRRWHPV